MAKKGGSKEGFVRDPSMSMPSEQKNSSESTKQKIARVHDIFPDATKDQISKILQYYDEDESKTLDAITRDGGKEALSNWADSSSLRSKNTKNKKKKKKTKKDSTLNTNAAASFDADDSSSIHSSGNVDAEAEKDYLRTENGNEHFLEVEDTKTVTSPLSSHERLKNVDEAALNDSGATLVTNQNLKNFREHMPDEPSSSAQTLCKDARRDSEVISRGSPVSDTSEKLDDQKKEKYRSNDGHTKHLQRQRTSSFRRSKTSSLSEDSSQYNPQAIAAPTKRGFEKCKKDLNRQTISLQRIQAQLDRGLEESTKKLKNAFNDVHRMLEKRQGLVEEELEKTKEAALNLLKSRQDLAVELKRRVDRTPSLTEADWSELRSDIKQFVTERKYDDELGKTIWFQWSLDSITDVVNTFGEVQPVKNAYSQRSQSALGHTTASRLNAEPSPSSSLANEDINSTADKNDVGNISDTAEDETPVIDKESIPASKFQTGAKKPLIFSNSQRYSQGGWNPNQNRGTRGYNRGNRGFGYRQNNRNNYNYRNNSYNSSDVSNDYRHHDRSNEGHSYDRNMNRNDRSQGRGQNTNYRSGGGRTRGNPSQQRQNADTTPKGENPSTERPTSDAERQGVMNGFVNN